MNAWKVERERKIVEFVKAVRQHAEAHYGEGWDIVVECWEDADIRETIQGVHNAGGAIRKVAKVVGIVDSHRKEIEATAW